MKLIRSKHTDDDKYENEKKAREPTKEHLLTVSIKWMPSVCLSRFDISFDIFHFTSTHFDGQRQVNVLVKEFPLCFHSSFFLSLSRLSNFFYLGMLDSTKNKFKICAILGWFIAPNTNYRLFSKWKWYWLKYESNISLLSNWILVVDKLLYIKIDLWNLCLKCTSKHMSKWQRECSREKREKIYFFPACSYLINIYMKLGHCCKLSG